MVRPTKRANRVLEEILRGYVHSFLNWSEFLPMMEFAINNSVHALTTHTPFFVNGLRRPHLPTFLECDSSLRGGGTHSSNRQSGSHSSRADNAVTTFDADVDHIESSEEGESKSKDAIAGHDTDQISITPSASKDTLTEATIDRGTVRSKSTAAKYSESADEFILACETVVRFVQDSIAEAVDRQKRNADKNGRENVL